MEAMDASIEDAKNLIIFSKPKAGKTTIASQLPNAVILDFEEGSDFVSAIKIKILGLSAPSNEEQIDKDTRLELNKLYLNEFVLSVKKYYKEHNEYPYKYGVIDTATSLEEQSFGLAVKMYKETTVGKNYKGTDVRTLAKGSGYLYTRKAYQKIMSILTDCFPKMILLGHVKDSVVAVNGKEQTIQSLDLTGKLASIISSKSDAIAYMYINKEKQGVLDFKISNDVIAGARPSHLRDKEIIISELDGDNVITHWDRVFKQL